MNDHLSFAPTGEHPLVYPVLVVDNDGVGHVEDSRSGSVVLVQDDVLVRPEGQKPVRLRPSPFVDRLVWIPDDEQVATLFRQRFDNLPIPGVAVLRLVQHHIVHPLLPLLLHF